MVLTERLERSSPRYEGGVLPDELGQRFHLSLPETSDPHWGLYRTGGALMPRARHPENANANTRQHLSRRKRLMDSDCASDRLAGHLPLLPVWRRVDPAAGYSGFLDLGPCWGRFVSR